MKTEHKAMLAAAVAYSIFGLSYLFSKMALDLVEPAILLCARFLVTVIVLNVLVLMKVVKLRFRGKNIMGPIALGLIQPVLYFLLENYGLKHTNTSFTGMVSSVSPIFTALLGAVFLREKPTGRQWLSVAVCIAGVLMVSLGTSSGENTVMGCLCLLGAYLAGGFYSVLVRKLSKEYSAFELTYIMFTVGFVFFAGMAFVQNGGNTLPLIGGALMRPKFIIACLYLGGAASVGAYSLANYSLAYLPVARSSVFNSFATLVSVLSGVVIMKDPFTWVSALAFILMMGGVWGVNRFAVRTES